MADGDPWVCGNCHSINQERSTRCYSCRTPRALALDLDAPSTSRLIPKNAPPGVQAKVAAEAGATYHTSMPLAIAFGVVVAVVSAITIVRLVDLLLVDPNGGLASLIELDARAAGGLINLAWLIGWLLGSVTWGLWLSRVVANLPALGGGWPNATPRATFLESLVPVFNVYWTAAILREALTRLSAPRPPRLGAWAAWTVCLVVAAAVLVRLGPMAILRTIVVTIIGNVIAFVAGPGALFDAELGLEVLVSSLIVIAGFAILRIVGSIESLQGDRRLELAGPRPNAVSR
jgi:hypothetical protein